MAKNKITVWKARMLEENDYDTLLGWWTAYDFLPAPPRDFLPDNGTCGIMLEDSEGLQYCAGFIYFTNSSVAWLEFIVSNPEIKESETRKEMLIELIDNLSYFAKDNEAKWVFTSVENKSLRERFKDGGFQTGTQGATEMIKQL